MMYIWLCMALALVGTEARNLRKGSSDNSGIPGIFANLIDSENIVLSTSISGGVLALLACCCVFIYRSNTKQFENVVTAARVAVDSVKSAPEGNDDNVIYPINGMYKATVASSDGSFEKTMNLEFVPLTDDTYMIKGTTKEAGGLGSQWPVQEGRLARNGVAYWIDDGGEAVSFGEFTFSEPQQMFSGFLYSLEEGESMYSDFHLVSMGQQVGQQQQKQPTADDDASELSL